jgi:hypothetical protein
MITRLHRAHTRIPLACWRPQRRQHRLVRPPSASKCALRLITASFLPAPFFPQLLPLSLPMHSRQSRLHQLRRSRLTQALLSRSQGHVVQYSIFDHHGPAWMEGQGRPATRPRSRRCDKVHQQIRQRARNHFRWIPPRLERCACMPQVLPAEKRGPALLHQHQDGRTSAPPRPAPPFHPPLTPSSL